ncbi:hypothetical protein [Glycomyces albidus]|jgi:hypothetical protein|uniref:Transporter n=1 Tax=Glycomyces albidus TaxID=2656774 RepID=A0A6L5G9Q1_9ACTN|nr:hypothetical protein [Glycomyces albidus]MQM26303.1 hypothetical protein [Glycomyces albidus]
MVITATPPRRTDRRIVAVGSIMALWCVGFAVVNVWFEATGHFSDGKYADYAQGLLVMNVLVVVLKLLGAAVELLAVADRPRLIRPAWTSTLAFGAFAMLGVYAAAGVVEGTVLVVTGSDEVTAASVAYVLFFVLGATGFGLVAVSHWRRYRPGRAPVVVGAVGAPVMLVLILSAAPWVLGALGVMPSS